MIHNYILAIVILAGHANYGAAHKPDRVVRAGEYATLEDCEIARRAGVTLASFVHHADGATVHAMCLSE